MCTSNVESLAVGSWIRAAILSVKGRLVSVVDIVKRDDALVLVCEPVLAEKTKDTLEKYAIVDDVVFTLVRGPLHRVWTDPDSVWSAAPVFATAPSAAASEEEVEVRRVEAGLPKYGVDISEDHFPFETPLDRHIDYEKGCYIGQEPVARVHARGSGNKTLRGLRIEGDGVVTVGAELRHSERDQAGVVTSAAVSPTFGAIAIAYVHKIAWDPGTTVLVEGRSAVVCELPLTS